MTAFNPERISRDPELLQLFEKTVQSGTQLYLMNHFNHPREFAASRFRPATACQCRSDAHQPAADDQGHQR
jgi:L-lysine 2,3-aminomutase